MRISQPTPELPVPNVRAAQEYYRDVLGFEIAWHNEEGKLGAVACGECAIFFRECAEEAAPSTFWVFCDDVDETHAELLRRRADITGSLDNKPWGLRQFTVRDAYQNRFYFFHEL